MIVEYFDSEFEIPDILIDKYAKDFDGLPGGRCREGVQQIRDSIEEILDIISEEPELLYETEYLTDFVGAMAMKQALSKLGILYDA
jgi:hypothetical protein